MRFIYFTSRTTIVSRPACVFRVYPCDIDERPKCKCHINRFLNFEMCQNKCSLIERECEIWYNIK